MPAQTGKAAELVEFLKRESNSIADLDPERLLADAAEKQQRFTRLALLAAEHEAFLAQHGYPADRAGMQALFDAHPQFAASVGEVWRSLVQAMEDARALNKSNGRLIRDRRAYYESRLAALAVAARSSLVYGRDGQTMGFGMSSLDARA